MKNPPVSDRSAATPAQPTSDDMILALENLVSFKISLLAKLLERRLARLVGGQFGLSVAEYRVLAQVIMHPGSTVRAIAARTLVDKAQVSRAVASLEEQKLIVRSVSIRDRRSPVVSPTRSGKALIRKIAPSRLAQEDEIIAQLDSSTAEEFRRTLTILFDAFIEGTDESPVLTAAQRRESIRSERARSGT